VIYGFFFAHSKGELRWNRWR